MFNEPRPNAKERSRQGDAQTAVSQSEQETRLSSTCVRSDRVSLRSQLAVRGWRNGIIRHVSHRRAARGNGAMSGVDIKPSLVRRETWRALRTLRCGPSASH